MSHLASYTCHVTGPYGIVRRVEVQAKDPDHALRIALAGRPGRVSCRIADQGAPVLASLAVRASGFPLIGAL